MSNGIGKNPLTDISKVYIETIRESYKIEPPKERLKTDRNMFNIPKDEQQLQGKDSLPRLRQNVLR